MPSPRSTAATLLALLLLLQLLVLAEADGMLAGVAAVLSMMAGLGLYGLGRRPPATDVPPPADKATDEAAADAGPDVGEMQSQFLSMVAHEVRTPLSVITASTGTLRLLAPDDQPAIGERIERIDRAVRRMKRLFQLCLDAEHIERQKKAPERWVTVAGAVVSGVMREMDEDIACRVQVEDQTAGREIQVDRRMLGIVFSNLIDNAVKYSPPGTPITVRLEVVAPDGLQVDVIDQGPGIPEALRERIFDKHFRRQELNDVPGLGLGLYLARRILGEHGGSIVALPGDGGHFRICIPTNAPPDPRGI